MSPIGFMAYAEQGCWEKRKSGAACAAAVGVLGLEVCSERCYWLIGISIN